MKTIEEHSRPFRNVSEWSWPPSDFSSDQLLALDKPFVKTKEYYVFEQDYALHKQMCPGHFIVALNLDFDNSRLVFGCTTCGYREDWVSENLLKNDPLDK